MADGMFDESGQESQINEEYKIWKKNAPFLYDLVISHEMTWPSLSVQWLPKKDSPAGQDYTIHKLIIGTNTGGAETNYLMIAKVRLPKEDTIVDGGDFQNGIGMNSGQSKIEIETKMVHDGEVNRARYCPQRQNVIASYTPKGEIHIFDFHKHPSKPESLNPKPDQRFLHDAEGFGLAWSENRQGNLLSGGYDGKIKLWDVESNSSEPQTFIHSNIQIEDVAWHKFHQDLIGSCGVDRHIKIWDIRQPKALQDLLAHSGDIYSMDFSPFQEFLLVSGSEDGRINLFDMRNAAKYLHTFEGHKDQVMAVKFSPHYAKVFASSSADRRTFIWDFGRCGQPQTQEEQLDGPPELLVFFFKQKTFFNNKKFIHGGHRSKVPDFDWNINERYIIASVEENNILHVWQLGQHIYA